MDRCFEAPSKRLAQLIARHEQTLAVRCAGGMEIGLLRIGPVEQQFARLQPPQLFRLQGFQFPEQRR